jgi:hypothetical protein
VIRRCETKSGNVTTAPDTQVIPSAIWPASILLPFGEILKYDGNPCEVTPVRAVSGRGGAASAGTLPRANAPIVSPLASASRSHHLAWLDRLLAFMVTLLSVGRARVPAAPSSF